MLDRSTVIGLVPLFVCLVLTLNSSGQTTWIVDDDNGTWADYEIIQDAINASTNGDIIKVYNGIYNENIVINVTVTLFGNGSEETMINGDGQGNVINVTANNVVISGFKINNTGDSYPDAGVYLDNVNDTKISENNMSNLYIAINMVGSHNTSIIQNLFNFTTRTSIWADECNNNTIKRNNGSGPGLIDFWLSYDNMIRENVFNVTSFSGEAVSILDCRYIVIRENYFFNDTEGVIGVDGVFVFRSSNISVIGNTIKGTRCGVYLRQSDNNTVISNTITDVNLSIVLDRSSKNRLLNNTIVGSNEGMYIRDGSTYNVINNNTISESDYGIWMRDSSNNSFLNNSIHHNSEGIYITFHDASSNDNVFANNSIFNNSNRGINIVQANDTIIIYNEIYNNGDYGIDLQTACNNSVIHHNNFVNNGESFSQARDNGTGNLWDNGEYGNHWSDWGGSGNYSIAGSSDTYDDFPNGSPFDTNAPEKVSEFPFFPTIAFISIVAIAVFRRRRRR